MHNGMWAVLKKEPLLNRITVWQFATMKVLNTYEVL